MAPDQRKKEKEQFFEDLSRLDQFSDDGDENVDFLFQQSRPSSPPSVRAIEGFLVTENDVFVSHADSHTSHAHRKRKACENKPVSMPSLQTADPVPQPIGPSSSPLRDSKKPKPGSLKRFKSHLDNPDPLWRKGDPVLKYVAEDFIPNEESKLKDPIYRLRIRKSIQHGAMWARIWSGDVTHIIVCDDLNWSQVSKCFHGGEVPKSPILVLVDWVVESVRSKYSPNICSSRYQVQGSIRHESRAVQDKLVPDRTRYGTAVGNHTNRTLLPGKSQSPAREIRKISPTEVPSIDEVSEIQHAYNEDSLQDAIKDVQQLGIIPVDSTFGDAPKCFADGMDEDAELRYLKQSDKIRKENEGFLCMEKHEGNKDNPNSRTIKVLQQMATYYDRIGDHWRTTGYRKGIGALRKQSQLIRTKQEALAIPQIGERLAEKIEEIVTTERLRQLEYTKLDLKDQVLQLFMGIYHVGYPTASRWIAQGHRTLDELIQNVQLNANQRIGIEHYEDFQKRIPRAEVAEHASIVEKVLAATDDGLQMIIGGSYRRGARDSGDIDLIITKEGASLEHIRTLMMEVVVPTLTAQGFLKAKLAAGGPHEMSSKWHGACALPESETWRRIDLLFVPWAELGAALIYFTGNDIFNRSLRLLASRKQMRLNQHGLYADVMRGRGRERITEGTLLEGQDELRIFELLGVPYRPPEHRQC
ncbi:uncharacterized protein A1O9_07762 [Exophiala aquamarina CBS 119918]|uniref:DNA polymerase n=1 Tax=Exophiala aquamarina CBS 119918 TaxID=1182545 RepID=A0A072P8I4_9EURO|nr:uncharacterized protein A1O9_07762 [Exophiala aquamarina CBS 119918]KEF56181.1 hypothetical protein A1O9_07762 [Exophiala aquamarina CBS 119918]